MYYEQRTYIAAPGKLEALKARFKNHTLRLFEKHGIQVVGFWTPDERNPTDLIYILAFPDKEACDKAWNGFRNDPEWHEAKANSEKDGVLVAKIISQYLVPTDFSPLK